MNLKEFLFECELETKEGECFSLGHAITEYGCEQLADIIIDKFNLCCPRQGVKDDTR